MKKSIIVLGLLFAKFALFAQSINADFETDKQGWTAHFSGIFNEHATEQDGRIEWAKLPSPLNTRGGISFSGKNHSNVMFLYIQKEITDLAPNTDYRVIFNMDWVSRMNPSASPITVKVGAVNKAPMFAGEFVGTYFNDVEEESIEEEESVEEEKIAEEEGEDENLDREDRTFDDRWLWTAVFDKGEPGRNGRDFRAVGQLIPNEFGYPFQQNLHNFDSAFLAKTDESGRLFLMIGVEPEQGNIENVFLNTVRVILIENDSKNP